MPERPPLDIAVWVKVNEVQFSDISFQRMLELLPSFLCHTKKKMGTNLEHFQVALLEKIMNSQFYCDFSFLTDPV